MRKIFLSCIACGLVISIAIPCPVNAEQEKMESGYQGIYSSSNLRGDYQEYAEKYKEVPSGEREIRLLAEDAIYSRDVAFHSYAQRDKTLVIEDEGELGWQVQIPSDGKYLIEIQYCPLTDFRNDIELKLTIDGKLPFSECAKMGVPRLWRSASGVSQDNRGNDIAPKQTVCEEWWQAALMDFDGIYSAPFWIYFEEGEHTLSLSFTRGGIAVEQLILASPSPTVSYANKLSSWEQQGATDTSGILKIYQAEETLKTSSPTLGPIYDKSNASTQPSSPYYLRLNTVGGTYWKEAGQWIEWEIEAPQSGFYHIGFKYRQDLSEGFFSTRKLYLDNEILFSQLEDLRFEYDTQWKTYVIGSEDPYKVYLTKGSHTLRLEATTGVLADAAKQLQDMIYDLNDLYRQIVTITGTSPDIFRDYYLHEDIPEMIPFLTESATSLHKLADFIESLGRDKNSEASYLRTIAYQLNDIAERPETLKERLSAFKDNISGLASWMLQIKEQPLELDYIVLKSPDVPMPKASEGIGKQLVYSLQSFIASFINDYSNIGNFYEGGSSIRAWMLGGRDQAQVAKNLIDSSFVPQANIGVNLELVQGGINEAILSGNAPDVIMNLGRSDPVNLGCRNALLNLEDLEGYNEVISQFTPEALVPYRYENKTYGLPVELNFCMMFYRTDVFEKMGLEPPATWEEFYKVVNILSRNNLQVGVPVPVQQTVGGYDLFTALLYQAGGAIYNEEKSATVLDSPQAIGAFTQWTNLFVDMGLPLRYDFYSRFRTGEMPLAIQYYSQYNLLMASAPEITNMWKMIQLPGTRREDGTLDRSIMATGTSCGINRKTTDVDSSWAFLKWWVSAETQASYGEQLESIMGAAARYNTANVKAMKMLPWSQEEYTALYQQMAEVREIPEMPASYFVYRSLSNAFRKVIYNYEVNPREALIDYNLQMNKEITRKLKEFE